MNFLQKSLLILACLTPGFGMVANNDYRHEYNTPAQPTETTLKDGFNAAFNSTEVKAATKKVKRILNSGLKLHAHYLNPVRLFETPADRLLWVAAVWTACVEGQAVVDFYDDCVNTTDSRGWFEWLFSLREKSTNTGTPKGKYKLKPNAFGTLGASLAAMALVNLALQ